MTKFCVYKDTFEFRMDLRHCGASAAQIWNLYDSQDWRGPELVAELDSLEEARAELKGFIPYSDHQRGHVFWLVVGRLAWIVEEERDVDGELIQDVCVWDYAAAELEPDSSFVAEDE